MGFLLLQIRPGGGYLKGIFVASKPLWRFWHRERQRERDKFFVYQNRLDLASLNYFIAHLHWGFGAIAFMICASWLAHMISSCLNPVADGCGHNWPPCTGLFFFWEGGRGSCVNLVWKGGLKSAAVGAWRGKGGEGWQEQG